MINGKDCPESCKCVCYSLAEFLKKNDIPAPENSGLDNVKIGEDGLTDYARNIRCALQINNVITLEDINSRTTWLLN